MSDNTDLIELEIGEDPVPWQRRIVNKKTGGVFYPDGYRNFKKMMSILLLKAKSLYIMEPDIKMTVQFNIPMPKSWSIKKREKMKGRPHSQVPDLDNLVKGIKDSLNGKAYKDDRHITDLSACKRWAEVGSFRIILRKIV